MIYINFVYSCLKKRKQNVKIDDILNLFQPLISDAALCFILSLILFNIFLNNLVTKLQISDIYKTCYEQL